MTTNYMVKIQMMNYKKHYQFLIHKHLTISDYRFVLSI